MSEFCFAVLETILPLLTYKQLLLSGWAYQRVNLSVCLFSPSPPPPCTQVGSTVNKFY